MLSLGREEEGVEERWVREDEGGGGSFVSSPV